MLGGLYFFFLNAVLLPEEFLEETLWGLCLWAWDVVLGLRLLFPRGCGPAGSLSSAPTAHPSMWVALGGSGQNWWDGRVFLLEQAGSGERRRMRISFLPARGTWILPSESLVQDSQGRLGWGGGSLRSPAAPIHVAPAQWDSPSTRIIDARSLFSPLL